MINRIYYLILCTFLLFISYSISYAQIIPVNNDTLNYRIVGFSVPASAGNATYIFEVSKGYCTDNRSFRKNIILKRETDSNKIIEKLPSFGSAYTWRVRYKDKKRATDFYHFAIAASEYADTSKYRLRIINNSILYDSMLVILDFAPLIYDMHGQLVWFLPDIPGVITKGQGLRDLKPTHDGTFTVLNNFGAYEFDYNGKILWKAPNDGRISGDSIEHYHHEFTKKPDGHYMIAGYEIILRKVPDNADTTNFINDKTIVRKDGVLYKTIDCPTIIEYDSSGRITWFWKSSSYFTDKDYFSIKAPDGTFISAPHMNSFYLDDSSKYLYIGFRNYSRILKMEYSSRKIVAVYGQKQNTGAKQSDLLFRAQHFVRATTNGEIYLFNNNGDRESRRPSTIAKYTEPQDNTGNLTKIWEFPCLIDNNAPPLSLAGGSAYILPDSSFLVSMGMAGRIFIVDPAKTIIWNAMPEYKLETGGWIIEQQYRTSFISNYKGLYKFIFN